jgi:Kef-type K+ transport system membrane component KefB
LIIVELLARGGTGLFKALSIAGVKAIVTLSAMSLVGFKIFLACVQLFFVLVFFSSRRRVLDPIFSHVAKSNSHEAFLSIILSTVLLMSFVTKGYFYLSIGYCQHY